jgi:hypothetical protein
MKKILIIIFYSVFFLHFSCSEEEPSGGINYKEDPNNFFTATFGGKTLKTTGFIYTINGAEDDMMGSATIVNAILDTRNIDGMVETILYCSVEGSLVNTALTQGFKIPEQQLDAFLFLERTGDAVGSYNITALGANITDLTVGNKKYDLDPLTTTINVTAADVLWVQGTYTGNLLDGSKKIPVVGSFKLRKL